MKFVTRSKTNFEPFVRALPDDDFLSLAWSVVMAAMRRRLLNDVISSVGFAIEAITIRYDEAVKKETRMIGGEIYEKRGDNWYLKKEVAEEPKRPIAEALEAAQ